LLDVLELLDADEPPLLLLEADGLPELPPLLPALELALDDEVLLALDWLELDGFELDELPPLDDESDPDDEALLALAPLELDELPPLDEPEELPLEPEAPLELLELELEADDELLLELAEPPLPLDPEGEPVPDPDPEPPLLD
jgi:hypothetical protein